MATRHNRGHSYRAPRLITRGDILKDDGDDTMTWSKFHDEVGKFPIPGQEFDFMGNESGAAKREVHEREGE